MSRHGDDQQEQQNSPTARTVTAVLEMSGVSWATSKNIAEAVLSRRPGVLAVDANPVGQVATVTYDPDRH